MQLVHDSTINADAIVGDARKFFYYACLTAVESGIIVRHWYEQGGKEQIQELAWVTARALGLFIMLIACVYCTVFFYAVQLVQWLEKNLSMGTSGGWANTPDFGAVEDEIQPLDFTEAEQLVHWAKSLSVVAG